MPALEKIDLHCLIAISVSIYSEAFGHRVEQFAEAPAPHARAPRFRFCIRATCIDGEAWAEKTARMRKPVIGECATHDAAQRDHSKHGSLATIAPRASPQGPRSDTRNGLETRVVDGRRRTCVVHEFVTIFRRDRPRVPSARR